VSACISAGRYTGSVRELCGLNFLTCLTTSPHQHKIMRANCYSSNRYHQQIQTPNPWAVTDTGTPNGFTLLQLAASYTVRSRDIIALALVGYVYSRLAYYPRD